MNISMVCPAGRHCGIAFYSQRLTGALRDQGATVINLDSDLVRSSPVEAAARCRGSGVTHVQFESSLYSAGRQDQFIHFVKALEVPLVVTLHEVYHDFPWDFPRSSIRGPVAPIRRWVYDLRHPLATAYRRLAANSFGARAVCVHHGFQAEILAELGTSREKIHFCGYPYPAYERLVPPDRSVHTPLRLAALGFVNPAYDYDLLFAVLDCLTIPWVFTWIGGSRNAETAALENELRSRITTSPYKGRFSITGWIEKDEHDHLIDTSDIILALFRYRSSSESIATLVSRGSCVVAIDGKLTRSIAGQSEALDLAPPDAAAVADSITQLACNPARISRLRKAARVLAEEESAQAVATRTLSLYRNLNLAGADA